MEAEFSLRNIVVSPSYNLDDWHTRKSTVQHRDLKNKTLNYSFYSTWSRGPFEIIITSEIANPLRHTTGLLGQAISLKYTSEQTTETRGHATMCWVGFEPPPSQTRGKTHVGIQNFQNLDWFRFVCRFAIREKFLNEHWGILLIYLWLVRRARSHSYKTVTNPFTRGNECYLFVAETVCYVISPSLSGAFYIAFYTFGSINTKNNNSNIVLNTSDASESASSGAHRDVLSRPVGVQLDAVFSAEEFTRSYAAPSSAWRRWVQTPGLGRGISFASAGPEQSLWSLAAVSIELPARWLRACSLRLGGLLGDHKLPTLPGRAVLAPPGLAQWVVSLALQPRRTSPLLSPISAPADRQKNVLWGVGNLAKSAIVAKRYLKSVLEVEVWGVGRPENNEYKGRWWGRHKGHQICLSYVGLNTLTRWPIARGL